MSSNITMLIPEVAVQGSGIASMLSLISSLLWGGFELVASIAIIAAYSFMLCYAAGLVLRNEQSLEHSNDPDLPNKEQTAALMLTGFLGGIHVMMVFYGLPLFGHESDSFLMRLMFSCALLAAGTTAIIVGGIVVYLVGSALVSCTVSVIRRVRGTPKSLDVEETVGDLDSDIKQPFLEKIDEKE